LRIFGGTSGLGKRFGNQLLDLASRFVRCSTQKHLSIGFREVRAQNHDAAQMKAPVGKHLKEHGVFSGRTGHLYAQNAVDECSPSLLRVFFKLYEKSVKKKIDIFFKKLQSVSKRSWNLAIFL
jgi:hypothetical protein